MAPTMLITDAVQRVLRLRSGSSVKSSQCDTWRDEVGSSQKSPSSSSSPFIYREHTQLHTHTKKTQNMLLV